MEIGVRQLNAKNKEDRGKDTKNKIKKDGDTNYCVSRRKFS